METLRTHEENLGIPEDSRCKRSDGKQWRCTAMSMPDKTVCEKHYIQAKRRAANSALRASLKKAQKRTGNEDGDLYFDNQEDEFDGPLSVNSIDGDLNPHKKPRERTSKNQPVYSSESSMREMLSTNPSPEEGDCDEPMNDYANGENVRSRRKLQYSAVELSRDRYPEAYDLNGAECSEEELTESSEDVGAQPCHQCRKRSKNGIVWCLRCRRGYCVNCVSERYSNLSLEEIEKFCPGCRGICFCRSCIRTDNIIKVRIREMPVIDKLLYLYYIMSSVLPVLKKIHQVQCAEIEFEKQIEDYELMLHRTKLNADEQMCCNICRIPIIDYHRHCTNCSYDICLHCCEDLREVTVVSANRNDDDKEHYQTSRPKIDMLVGYPLWKANRDGSIPCPPQKYGGCGRPSLSLNRIFKLSWVAKLVKSAQELVDGCRLTDAHMADKSSLRQCSFREYCDDNHLYFPSFDDLKAEGIKRFLKHWLNGNPVVVTDVFDFSETSKWDPFVILEDIQETSDEKEKSPNRLVKAVDCYTGSHIDVELEEFFRGFSEGVFSEDGIPKLLKLEDWPSPIASEEFLSYQRPDFYARVPLLEFIHSKLGVLNVAAKLPHYSLQNDSGPKIRFSYGTYEEHGKGDAVTNLSSKIRDMVYVLMNTNEAKHASYEDEEQAKLTSEEIDRTEDKNKRELSTSGNGVSWDVFRREDSPKIIEYLEKFSDDEKSGRYILYNGTLFLNADQKKDLKETFGVEAWSFKQQVGQAVFVPAGCPFQTRNLESTVQLELSFLSPGSLSEADKISEEIRCLPNNCEAKVHVLEIGKISLYAASVAIKEVQQLVLDPKLGDEIGFEDTDLTADVCTHLQMLENRSQRSCL